MAIDLDVHGNTKPLEAAVQAAINRIRRQPIKITVDDKGATQPLGNMKRAADEFSKSMEAANARILAFGASMAIINGVADAFKGMVRNLVEVEKSLADINVVMGLSTQNLDKFGDGLFKVAKETGAAFRVAADAATEYARQGLAVEETLKRTRDALVLTRLTGMDSAEAVKSLTAAMNTYGNQIKDTTQLVSKFAAVDVQFAVSAEDFAAAISRTGQAAKSAGVNIDELIGIVTSAQQQTARGGAVIGNALKTIFTKTGRTDTLNQLENLGIAVRDLEGNTIGAKRILSDLANTFDTLSEAQKAQITQTMGGLFHINILKAVLSDAAKQNGILANATQISANATDEAIQKNEQLRATMSAMAGETGNAIKQLSVQIGELMLAPGMEKILNTVKSLAEGASDILGDGEGAGNKFATGFLKGLGNIITGPGLVVLTAVFIKLFASAVKFTKESLTSLIGVTSEAQKQKAIQTTLVTLLGQNAALGKEMLRTDISRTEKEKILLGLLRMQTAEAENLNRVSKQLASTLYTKGYGPGLTQGKRRAYGHIPNFADPERAQAAKGGYAAGSIRTMNMPGEGSVIYNSAETVKNFAGFKQPAIMPPQSSKAGKNYQRAFGSIHGFDPYAAGGFIPNFIKPSVKLGSRPDITTPEQARAAGYSGAAISARFGKGGSGKTTVSHSSDLGTFDLNQLFPNQIKSMGVLLGFGREGSTAPQQYKQTYNSLPGPARNILNKKLGIKKPSKATGKKSVVASLPTKAVYEITDADTDNIEQVLGKSSLEKKLYNYVGVAFDKFSHAIGMDMFGGKIGKAGTNVLKTHMDGSLLGNLFESAVRGSLDNKKVQDSQAPFDFMGSNAKNISKFMGQDGLSLIEGKYSLAAAKSGGIPKKILNYIAGSAANGFIPNFADPLSDAIGREKAAGVPVSQIRVGSHSALMSKGNPLGLGVTNTHDEPNGLRDVFGANGFVPNYAPTISSADIKTNFRGNPIFDKRAKQFNELLGRTITKYKDGLVTYDELNRRTRRLSSMFNLNSDASDRVIKETSKSIGPITKLNAARNRLTTGLRRQNQRLSGTAVGRGLSSTGGQMGIMMGLPMAGSFIGDAVGGQTGVGINSAFSGAATGASMGMMFGPLGIAIGTTAGALFGLVDATKKATEAQEEAAKKRSQELTGMGAEVSQALASFKVFNIKDAPSMKGFNLGRQDYVGKITTKVEPGYGDKFFNYMKGLDPDQPKVKTRTGLIPEKAKKAALDYISKEYGADSEEYSMLAPEIEKIIQGKGSERLNTDIITFDQAIQGRIAQLNKQFQGIDEAVERQTMIKNLESMPEDFTFKGKKVLTKTESEALSKAGKAVPLEDYTGPTLAQDLKKLSDEEFTAYKEGAKKGQKAYQDSLKEQARGVIIQLNLQKAQIQAQRNAADAQLDIKSKYLQQSNMLEMQEKLMGGLMTEQQKAQLKYNKSINKAAEAFDQAEATANATLKTSILQQVGSSDPLQQALKKSIGSQFKVGSKDLVRDISDKVAGMSADELLNTLKNIQKENKGNADIQQAINLLMETELQKRQNSVDLAQRQKEISQNQASNELKINQILADRKQLLDDMTNRMKDFNDESDFLEKEAALDRRILDAQRAGTGRYVSKSEQLSRDRAKMQEDIIPALKRQGVSGKKGILSEYAGKLNIGGFSAEEESQILAMGKDADISEIVKAKKAREFEDANRGGKMQQLTNQLNQYAPLSDERFEEFTGSSRESVKTQLESLVELDKARTGRNKDLNEEIERANKALKRQNVLNEKNVDAVKAEQKAREDIEAGRGFASGFRSSMDSMQDRIKDIDEQLGRDIPFAFADGLANAMTEALNGTKNIKDALTDAAISFLGMIQKAMMQKAAYSIVGAMGFSRGGNVRNYSRGGGVPAMVSNGEYVMGRDAVAKYGGSFMHGLNAGGKIPGFSNGGKLADQLVNVRREKVHVPGGAQPGSALASGFGGGRGHASGRAYQSRAMSGFFYSQSGNVGLGEDTSTMMGILQEEERKRQEAEAKRQAKKAKRRQLLGMVASIGLMYGLGKMNLFGTEAGPKITAPKGMTTTFSRNLPNQFYGGPIRKYASGGYISGKSGIDQIPAMLSEGEYVIRASSARQLGKPMLDRINAGKFNQGGAVSELMGSSETAASGGNTNNINISINMERGSGSKKENQSQDSSGQNPADRSSDEQNNAALAERIKQQVVAVIVEEQRPGGLLSE